MRLGACAVLCFLLSGCVAEAGVANVSLDISAGGGPARGSRSSDVDCPDHAELHLDIARLDGMVTVFVNDGHGRRVFDETYDTDDPEYSGAAGVGTSDRALFGAPGTWTVQADYLASELGLHATLTCAQSSG